jgi:AraC-like DNA-binding protein
MILYIMLLFDTNLQRNKRHSFIPHTHDHYEFHYITSGKCHFNFHEKIYKVSAGMFFKADPGEDHYIFFTEKDELVSKMSFHVRLDNSPHDKKTFRQLKKVFKKRFVNIGINKRLYFEQLLKMISSDKANLKKAGEYRFLSFIYEIEDLPKNLLHGENRIIEAALAAIHNDIVNPMPVAEMADNLGIDTSYFIRLFKSHLDMSPLQYINKLKMECASDLLLYSGQSINSIAAKIGYDDPLYFSRAFKKWSGTAPRNYRRGWLSHMCN